MDTQTINCSLSMRMYGVLQVGSFGARYEKSSVGSLDLWGRPPDLLH